VRDMRNETGTSVTRLKLALNSLPIPGTANVITVDVNGVINDAIEVVRSMSLLFILLSEFYEYFKLAGKIY
jgi:hypothetical protein